MTTNTEQKYTVLQSPRQVPRSPRLPPRRSHTQFFTVGPPALPCSIEVAPSQPNFATPKPRCTSQQSSDQPRPWPSAGYVCRQWRGLRVPPRSSVWERHPSAHVQAGLRACPLPRSVEPPLRAPRRPRRRPLARRSPAAVVAAAAAAAAGAGWGAEATQWHREGRDAAAATQTPAGRESRSAREPKE